MSGIFRQKALVKLKSPEQLDEPLKIMRRRTSWAYGTVFAVIVLGLTWASVGSLPTTGRGQGILLTPNTVAPIQSPADGQISRWYVSAGAVVQKGDLICALSQPALDRELAQARAKLTEIQAKNQTLKELRARSSDFSYKAIEQKREVLQERIAYVEKHLRRLRELAAQNQAKTREQLELQKKNLLDSRSLQKNLTVMLKKRKDSYDRLLKEKLTSDENARNMRIRHGDSNLKLSDIDVQIKELNVKEAQAAQVEMETRELISTEENTLTQHMIQLRDLDNREANLRKQDSEADFLERNEVSDLNRNIERVEQRLRKSRNIRADHTGRILEVTAAEGSVVTNGQRLAQIDTRQENSELIALAYFQDAVGKQLREGMSVRVSPTTVSQKRYGSIKGTVQSATPYPVTADAAANYIGNTAVAQRLTQDGYQIEVQVKLEPDPRAPSGYAWTSEFGPDMNITAGTSADVWVTYERRAPLSFVLPVLRKWAGL